jgi:RNA polymerase sigma-70 factor (ECF subfamily)
MGLDKTAAKALVGTEAATDRSDDPDMAIVRRVQAGDVAAFDQLLIKYRERLFGIVYNLTSNREDAADLTQEAFIKAFQSINSFKGQSSFFTWIYRIAVNRSITHLKKNRLRRFFSFENLDGEISQSECVELLATKMSSDKGALLSELQEKLNEALQTLSIKHRTVVVLHEIEGLSHQEIAQITGTTEGTVRSRLHYAKQQLQALLKEYLD